MGPGGTLGGGDGSGTGAGTGAASARLSRRIARVTIPFIAVRRSTGWTPALALLSALRYARPGAAGEPYTIGRCRTRRDRTARTPGGTALPGRPDIAMGPVCLGWRLAAWCCHSCVMWPCAGAVTGTPSAAMETEVSLLDFATLDATPLQRDPYDWIVVENFIRPETFKAVVADFPTVPGPGSHPPAELSIHGTFKALMDELQGPDFRAAIERKFDIDLDGRPTMYTVRGFVSERDGKIHTDSKTKIITVLLYMNEGWEADGGRLRLLRTGDSLDNPVAEVSPNGGTLLVFRRSDNSWHGHKPFAGPRRAIQLNWVTDADVVSSEQRRHAFSSRLKKIKNMILPLAG